MDEYGYPIHPAANIFPVMTAEEFEGLKQDIAEHGLRTYIVLDKGQVLDGRNRLRACKELHLEPDFCEMEIDDPITFVLSCNLHRRHLSASQRAQCAADVATLREGRPSKETPQSCGVAAANAAKVFGVSTRSVETAKHVSEKGDKAVVDAVKAGEISVSAAAKLVDAVPDKKDQRRLVREGKAAVAAAMKPRAKPVPEPKPEPDPVDEPADDLAGEPADFSAFMNEALETALREFDPPNALVVAWFENKTLQFK